MVNRVGHQDIAVKMGLFRQKTGRMATSAANLNLNSKKLDRFAELNLEFDCEAEKVKASFLRKP